MDKKIEYLNHLRKRVYFQLILLIIVLGMLWLFLGSYSTQFLIAGLVFIVFVGSMLYRFIVKNYHYQYKKELLPLAFKQLDENVLYRAEGYEKSRIKSLNLFGRFTQFKSEDYVHGVVDNIRFDCADVRIGYYRRSGKHRRYVPVCHGQLYIFDFPKDFRASIIIREKNIGRPSGLSPIKMENVLFNQTFHIYTNNEHECFYILTPHFMELLMKLEREHPGNLFIAIQYNKLYIGIHNNKNRLEPPLLEPIDSAALIKEISKDFQSIQSLVHTLKLNQEQFKRN